MHAKCTFETGNETIEQKLDDRTITDEYLLIECILRNIAAYHAMTQASGSYIDFKKAFEDQYKLKFGNLPNGLVEFKTAKAQALD